MKWARLLVVGLLAGCSVSDAAPGQFREGRRGLERGGGVTTSSLGPLDRYTWDLAIDGSACPAAASDGLNYQASGVDAGALSWGYGADAGTYSCNGSTAGLTNIGSLENEAMVVSGGDNCWNLNSTLFQGLADGADMWCRLVIQTGDNAGNRYLLSFGSSTSDFFGFYQNSTERQIATARTGALTALTGQTAVLSTATWYLIDWYYDGAAPTNPRWDNYVNGAATIGTEHTANLGALASGSRIAVGGQSSGQCSIGVPENYTLLALKCAIGANAAQFTGEAMHDAECVELGLCP